MHPGVSAQVANSSPQALQIQTPHASPLLHKALGAPPLPEGTCGAPAVPAVPPSVAAAPPLDGSEPASLLTGSGTSEPEAPAGRWRAGAPALPTSLGAPPAPLRAAPTSCVDSSAADSSGPPTTPGVALATSVVHGSVSQRSEASPMPNIALQDSTPPANAQSSQPKRRTEVQSSRLMRSGCGDIAVGRREVLVIAQTLLHVRLRDALTSSHSSALAASSKPARARPELARELAARCGARRDTPRRDSSRSPRRGAKR